MSETNGPCLMLPAALDALMDDVRNRLQRRTRTGSKYLDLVQVARIHQERGNALSALIYGASNDVPTKLACSAGCSTCCSIPSSLRAVGIGANFYMSILDAITIVENYADLRSSDGDAPERALRAAEQASHTSGLVPCPHLRSDGACGIYAFRPVSCKIWFSAELELCMRNRTQGYSKGVNPWTDESNRLYDVFQEPFMACVKEIDEELEYGGHDFLECFRDIARLEKAGLLDTLKKKIDEGELSSWDPFGVPGSA